MAESVVRGNVEFMTGTTTLRTWNLHADGDVIDRQKSNW